MYTCRLASAATKLAQSFGKLSLTNTALTQRARTTATATCSWSASMYTTTKPPAANMCLELCWLTWSQEQWTVCALDHSVNCSDRYYIYYIINKIIGILCKQYINTRTTLCLASLEPVTTGPKATTQKEQSSSTVF